MGGYKNTDLTPMMVDVLVILSGAGHQAMTAEAIKAMMEPPPKSVSKVFAGLKQRGLIEEGTPTYAFRYPHTRQRTWKIRWEGIPDPLWGRVMVDHARRHGYSIKSVMTEEDLKRCEVAA